MTGSTSGPKSGSPKSGGAKSGGAESGSTGPAVVFLSLPAWRATDLAQMPHLSRRMEHHARLVPSFPCVTWPVQTNMLTGCLPDEHGVVANGFYWRDAGRVEMWTAWNERILRPQIWDRLRSTAAGKTSAAWFPMLSKGCGANYVCMPAPVHNPDGSESLWCYTKPTDLYGDLLEALGHFPLQHFWGPLANIESTKWIVESAVIAAEKYRPDFFYLYVPHLDYAGQKFGPASSQAAEAVAQLDAQLAGLFDGLEQVYQDRPIVWMAASEYVITDVDHVTYPNRTLREADLLTVDVTDDGEQLDYEQSLAWALVDHQLAHIFVRDRQPAMIQRVRELFTDTPGIEQVLSGEERQRYQLDHPRCGDVVLVSSRNSWQAYYWWLDDRQAPDFALRVDIHRKPGYDPVELFFDPATKGIPLDATLVRGSHGAPAHDGDQHGVLAASVPLETGCERYRDIDVTAVIGRHLGLEDHF